MRRKKGEGRLRNDPKADPETIADVQVGIGEIKGALLEMADIDGLDDPGEAFDY